MACTLQSNREPCEATRPSVLRHRLPLRWHRTIERLEKRPLRHAAASLRTSGNAERRRVVHARTGEMIHCTYKRLRAGFATREAAGGLVPLGKTEGINSKPAVHPSIRTPCRVFRLVSCIRPLPSYPLCLTAGIPFVRSRSNNRRARSPPDSALTS